MKYKIKDKVKIKKDEAYCLEIQNILNRINHISIIKKVVEESYTYYRLENLPDWRWENRHLEGLIPDPIITRFELMEL